MDKLDEKIFGKILVRISEDLVTFICSHCKRAITKENSFTIDKDKRKRFNISNNNGSIYYCCSCGAKYELIKYSNEHISNGIKFKYTNIIEEQFSQLD